MDRLAVAAAERAHILRVKPARAARSAEVHDEPVGRALVTQRVRIDAAGLDDEQLRLLEHARERADRDGSLVGRQRVVIGVDRDARRDELVNPNHVGARGFGGSGRYNEEQGERGLHAVIRPEIRVKLPAGVREAGVIARAHAVFTRAAGRSHATTCQADDMSILKVALLASVTGCAIVPAKHTSTRSLGLRDGAVVEGADHGVVLSAIARGSSVTLHATHTLACERQIVEVTEVTRSREVAFHSADDPRARFFGAIVAPVVVPVSLLVSVAAVAVSEDEVSQQVRLDHTVAMSCTKPAAHEAIEVALPSGTTRRVLTDAVGAATLAIPDSEPYRGTLVAHAGAAHTEVAYALPVPAVTAARDAIRACAASQSATGALRTEITVDAAGAPRHLHIDRSDGALTSCIAAAIAPLRFPAGEHAMTVVVPLELTAS